MDQQERVLWGEPNTDFLDRDAHAFQTRIKDIRRELKEPGEPMGRVAPADPPLNGEVNQAMERLRMMAGGVDHALEKLSQRLVSVLSLPRPCNAQERNDQRPDAPLAVEIDLVSNQIEIQHQVIMDTIERLEI